jgi:transposase
VGSWNVGCGPSRRRGARGSGRGSCCCRLRATRGVEIAERVGCTEPTVILWRRRHAERGLAGVGDRPRQGRPPTTSADARWQIVWRTILSPPAKEGITDWSSRLLARKVGVDHSAVARVWQRYGLNPHRPGTFEFSTDPQLEAKVRDVVGLYLDPPEKAVVLCVDEKSQIQALDRTQPMLPVTSGLSPKRTATSGTW